MIKEIKGYKYAYYVSDEGQVFYRGKDGLVEFSYGKQLNEYLFVTLVNIDGSYTQKLVHRLVAEYFVDNKNTYPIVDHINSIKTDNKASNLQWVTYSMNNRKNSLGSIALNANDNKTLKHNNAKRIECYDLINGNTFKVFDSASEAARYFGIKSISNIVKVANGHRKSCCDYGWRYVK